HEVARRAVTDNGAEQVADGRQADEPDAQAESDPQADEEGPDDIPSPDCEFDLNIHRTDTLNRLAAAAPRAVWDRLIPHVCSLSEATRRGVSAPGEWFRDAFWARPLGRHRLVDPPDLVAALALAGAILALDDGTFLAEAVEELSASQSRTVQRLLGQVFLL